MRRQDYIRKQKRQGRAFFTGPDHTGQQPRRALLLQPTRLVRRPKSLGYIITYEQIGNVTPAAPAVRLPLLLQPTRLVRRPKSLGYIITYEQIGNVTPAAPAVRLPLLLVVRALKRPRPPSRPHLSRGRPAPAAVVGFARPLVVAVHPRRRVPGRHPQVFRGHPAPPAAPAPGRALLLRPARVVSRRQRRFLGYQISHTAPTAPAPAADVAAYIPTFRPRRR